MDEEVDRAYNLRIRGAGTTTYTQHPAIPRLHYCHYYRPGHGELYHDMSEDLPIPCHTAIEYLIPSHDLFMGQSKLVGNLIPCLLNAMHPYLSPQPTICRSLASLDHIYIE
jgi:hypothetical protein